MEKNVCDFETLKFSTSEAIALTSEASTPEGVALTSETSTSEAVALTSGLMIKVAISGNEIVRSQTLCAWLKKQLSKHLVDYEFKFIADQL